MSATLRIGTKTLVSGKNVATHFLGIDPPAVRVDRPGRYRPVFEFNNPESLNCYGRRFEITVAGQALRASVPLSGRHDCYGQYQLAGAFTLKRGLHTLTVKPYVLDPGILMNLRAVTLAPVA